MQGVTQPAVVRVFRQEVTRGTQDPWGSEILLENGAGTFGFPGTPVTRGL